MLGLERKWDIVGQHLHPNKSSWLEICQDHVNSPSWNTVDSSRKECDSNNTNSGISMNILNRSEGGPSNPVHLRSLKDENFLDKLANVPLRNENSFPDLDDGQTSPSSVVTDLGLELLSQPCKQQRKENDNWIKFSGDSDASNFKTLFKVLFERIGRQSEAVRVISQAVSHAWTRKPALRGDVWLNFIGSDVFCQRKIGLALAEVLYGNKNNFIHVDLSSNEELFQHTCHVRFRGKTIVDHITEQLREKPFCVVFLENVHFADPMVQHSLSQAIRNGRFSDSYGRDITTNNKIFILASRHIGNNFHEERLIKSKCYPLQILVRDIRNHLSNQLSATRNRNTENFSYQILLNKRKLNGKDDIAEQNVNVSQVKRSNQRSNMSLDLNLPAGIAEADTSNSGDPRSWLEAGLSDQVGKALVKVDFDSFDYDTQAEKIQKWINESFNKAVGLGCSLKIEPTVMDQILTASSLSNDDKNIKEWVNQVLSKGFTDAQKRYQLNTDAILILTTYGSVSLEEQAPEGCLPSKIITI